MRYACRSLQNFFDAFFRHLPQLQDFWCRMLRETEGSSASAASLPNVERFPQEPIRRLMRASWSNALPATFRRVPTYLILAQPQRCAHGHGEHAHAHALQPAPDHIIRWRVPRSCQSHAACKIPSPSFSRRTQNKLRAALCRIFHSVPLSCALTKKLLMLLVHMLMLHAVL